MTDNEFIAEKVITSKKQPQPFSGGHPGGDTWGMFSSPPGFGTTQSYYTSTNNQFLSKKEREIAEQQNRQPQE